MAPTLRELWPYAETPVIRIRQVLCDVAVLVWCVVWWLIANSLRDKVLELQSAGRRAESAGTGISERLRSAGDAVDAVPLAGKAVASRLRSAGDSANGLADAGRSAQEGVRSTASVLHAVLLVVLVGAVLVWWLWRRGRWTRTAFAARQLRATPEGLQVLGLRAAATAPLGTVAGVMRSVGGTGGVEAETLEALGRVELRRLGLRLRAVPVGRVW